MYVEENGVGVIKVGFVGFWARFWKWYLIKRRTRAIIKQAMMLRRKFRMESKPDGCFWTQVEIRDDYEEYIASKTDIAFSFDEALEIAKSEFNQTIR